jgi:hypothetical protein
MIKIILPKGDKGHFKNYLLMTELTEKYVVEWSGVLYLLFSHNFLT